jgi:2-polyprenyl-3-methyl-5-hydroxy-6-metoxy-1,4-benzoquinol methylase
MTYKLASRRRLPAGLLPEFHNVQRTVRERPCDPLLAFCCSAIPLILNALKVHLYSDHGGDEWSACWGGPEAQWYGAILPRIHAFVPADTILEIAPGFGRWTQFLKDYCRQLIIVDLSERCIEQCKNRFIRSSHIEYRVNDGRSLEFLADESIDFVFSFDSLVHVEADVIAAYLSQLAAKLKSNGAGFIHHSNLASYLDPVTNDLPPGLINKHWRARSVSAKLFEDCCQAARLKCTSQEIVNWGTEELTDAFSIFTPVRSVWSRSNRVLANPGFMDEADRISKIASLYSVRHWRDSAAAGVKTG